VSGSDLAFLVAFHIFILSMLALDLGLFRPTRMQASVPTTKSAARWVAVWVSLALAFGAGVFYWRGTEAGFAFLTGYIIEYSLSVDNLFVFLMIFTYFGVPLAYQRRVLFWGILGALVLRGTMILIGALLIKEFHWIIYVFGAFLVFTGLKMLRAGDEEIDPEKNPILRLARRFLPITPRYVGDKFFVRHGTLYATPLFLVLVCVETTDIVFAVDSIPAIFAITHDPFIVYTSNVFAILGLRSLYFLLRGLYDRFHHLKTGLAIVLLFVGIKMLLSDLYKIPTALSLGVVVTVLGTAVVVSLLRPRAAAATPAQEDLLSHEVPPETRPGHSSRPVSEHVAPK
jgi:tellurite resistance protein TerC